MIYFLKKEDQKSSLAFQFSTSKYFDLFAVIFLLRLDSFVSKSAFVIRFVCANLALKTLAATVLNSGVVTYLSWLWSLSFFSIPVIVVLSVFFLTKLQISGILFSTALNSVFVAKLLTSGILFSNSGTFVFSTKPVRSGTFFSNSVLSVWYLVF